MPRADRFYNTRCSTYKSNSQLRLLLPLAHPYYRASENNVQVDLPFTSVHHAVLQLVCSGVADPCWSCLRCKSSFRPDKLFCTDKFMQQVVVTETDVRILVLFSKSILRVLGHATHILVCSMGFISSMALDDHYWQDY